MHVDEALRTRISCRAFRPDPVPEATVRVILEVRCLRAIGWQPSAVACLCADG